MEDMIKIAQHAATYQFKQPEYEEVVDDLIEMLKILKKNTVQEGDPIHQPVKNLFWTLTMRVASLNSFNRQNV